jgi:hypothetical protein
MKNVTEKGSLRQNEKVTQIILRMSTGGRPNGVTDERKTGGNGDCKQPGIQIPVSKSKQKSEAGAARRLHSADRLTPEPGRQAVEPQAGFGSSVQCAMYGDFMPTQKLKSKTRVGSRETRVYDEPRSTFLRLRQWLAQSNRIQTQERV